MNSDLKQRGPARRQMNNVSLASNFEARYWMQALGVTRTQLEEAVRAVGTQVESVMDYLSVAERRFVDKRLIVQARSPMTDLAPEKRIPC